MTFMERSPLVRITKIDQCLRSKAYCSVRYLMQEIDVSRRTLFRDLSTLQEMGAPLSYSREYNGYFYVPGNRFKLPEVALTEGDLFAIILTEQAVNSLDKVYLGKKLESSMAKLRAMFQKKIKVAPDKIFSFNLCAQSPLNAETAQNIEKILKAIEKKNKLKIFYKKPYGEKALPMIIEPYHLHFRGKWYLFGWSEHSKDYRTYVVQRIEKMELLSDNFQPREFDPKTYIGEAWGIIKGKKTVVELEFTPERYAFMAEKIWHPSQKITKHKNGMMRMTMTVDGLDEVFWWILSYGSNVKVIRPKELIEKLRSEIKKILNIY